MIIEEDAYLEHYGKKGMKWGVRKVDPVSGKTSHKVVSVKRSELTPAQRRGVRFIYKDQAEGRKRSDRKTGDKAANAMLKMHGGVRIGSVYKSASKEQALKALEAVGNDPRVVAQDARRRQRRNAMTRITIIAGIAATRVVLAATGATTLSPPSSDILEGV